MLQRLHVLWDISLVESEGNYERFLKMCFFWVGCIARADFVNARASDALSYLTIS